MVFVRSNGVPKNTPFLDFFLHTYKLLCILCLLFAIKTKMRGKLKIFNIWCIEAEIERKTKFEKKFFTSTLFVQLRVVSTLHLLPAFFALSRVIRRLGGEISPALCRLHKLFMILSLSITEQIVNHSLKG